MRRCLSNSAADKSNTSKADSDQKQTGSIINVDRPDSCCGVAAGIEQSPWKTLDGRPASQAAEAAAAAVPQPASDFAAPDAEQVHQRPSCPAGEESAVRAPAPPAPAQALKQHLPCLALEPWQPRPTRG